MYFFTNYVYQILDRYKSHLELVDTVPLGFVAGAGTRPAPVFTNEQSEDGLYFAAGVNFSSPATLVRIQSMSPRYDWMADDASLAIDTPIGAVAGIAGTSMPVLPLIQPFFLPAHGRLQMTFTNPPTLAAPGGLWTWRVLRLTEPINGGWDYTIGLRP